MILKLWIAILISPVLFATEEPKKPKRKQFPVVDVVVSLKDTTTFLPGTIEEQDKAGNTDYRARLPKPFCYSTDFDKDPDPFVIGATNRIATLEKATHLTGSPFSTLEKRAFPRHESKQDGPSAFAWLGIGNFSMRSSNQGFLKMGQTLKGVLMEDLKFVRSLGISHQRLAEPLLVAIQEFEKVQEGVVRFSYRGNHNYTIEATKMPGKAFVSEGPKDPRDSFRSGWVGFGTQGSFFNDEIFSNWIFTIKEKSSEKVLTGDTMTPHLIFRYGFYQGGQFRMEPKAIIDFFNLPTKAGSK